MTTAHPGASQAVSELLGAFGLGGHVRVGANGRWRHDLVDDFRQAGLEVRAIPIAADTIHHLPFPAILIPGEGSWTFAGQAREASGWGEAAWTGALAVEVMGLAPAAGEPTLRRILSALAFRKEFVARVAMFGGGSAAAAVVIPLAAGTVMRRGLPEGAMGWLAAASSAVLLSALSASFMGWLRRRTLTTLMGFTLSGLQRGIIGHLLRLPYLALRAKTNGELSSVQRAEDCARAICGAAVDMTIQGLTLVAALAVMAFRMPWPALGAAGAAFLVGTVAWTAAVAKARSATERMVARQAHRSRLTEMISGVSSLRAHDSIGKAVSSWKGLLRRDILAVRQMGRISAIADSTYGFLDRAAWAGSLLAGAWLVTHKSTDMGSAITLYMLTAAIMAAAVSVGRSWGAIRTEMATVAKIDEVLTVPAVGPQPAAPRDQHGPISFEGVGFRYGTDLPWVLQNLDLSIREGETIWIKSPSGRGKTTLLRLMAGLTSPTCGQVLVGGQPIYGSGMPIGYLPQGATLLDDTIMENLLALSGWSTRAQILGMAEATGLDEMVRQLPMGYSTRAAAGTFSGGQRQLILLTGVLAQESKILLLDEPMANMDWAMREHMGPILGEQRRAFNRTLVYVSHDVPILCADRIMSPTGEFVAQSNFAQRT